MDIPAQKFSVNEKQKRRESYELQMLNFWDSEKESCLSYNFFYFYLFIYSSFFYRLKEIKYIQKNIWHHDIPFSK